MFVHNEPLILNEWPLSLRMKHVLIVNTTMAGFKCKSSLNTRGIHSFWTRKVYIFLQYVLTKITINSLFYSYIILSELTVLMTVNSLNLTNNDKVSTYMNIRCLQLNCQLKVFWSHQINKTWIRSSSRVALVPMSTSIWIILWLSNRDTTCSRT